MDASYQSFILKPNKQLSLHIPFFNEYGTFAFNDCRMLFSDNRAIARLGVISQYTKKEWIKEITNTNL